MSDDDWETYADLENNLTEDGRRRAGSVTAAAGLANERSGGGLTSMQSIRNKGVDGAEAAVAEAKAAGRPTALPVKLESPKAAALRG